MPNVGKAELLTYSEFRGRAAILFLRKLVIRVASLLTLFAAYLPLQYTYVLYEVTNTRIDGKPLIFDGTVSKLFPRYMLWLLLSLITLGIYAVFVESPVSIVWRTKYTHVLGVNEKSEFNGSLFKRLLIAAGSKAFYVITLGIGAGWAHTKKKKWYAEHTVIDGVPQRFTGRASKYLFEIFRCAVLVIATLGVYLVFVPLRLTKWDVANTHFASAQTE